MAFVYLDFNKTANGNGTWANAYSWVQAGSNTTANCVVANNIASGDEIRIVGRNYFTHSYPANSVYCNATSSAAIYINSANAIGTANGSFLWFKDIRPECGSGAWVQTYYQTNGISNTAIVLDTSTTSCTPVISMISAYPSFANATHAYCNSAVLAIDLNTSPLIPIQCTNDGVVFTSASASAHYFLHGLKSNTSITDNWIADGTRDTTLNSNNKTIIMLANTLPTAGGYKYPWFGAAFSDCGNINFDLRNTVFGYISGANGNTVPQSVSMRWGLFNTGLSAANTSQGMSYDIGAFTYPYPYSSNMPNVYVTLGAYRFATTAQTENFLRIRSYSSCGYIYYPSVQFSTTLTSTYMRTANSYNMRIDTLLSEGGYSAGTTVFGWTGANFNMIFGDMFTNSCTYQAGQYNVPATPYTYNFGVVLNTTTLAASNSFILFDRSRHGSAYSLYNSIPSMLPILIGISWTYMSYHARWPALRYAANGTFQLANNNIYAGGVLGSSSSGYPGSLAGGAVGVNQFATTSTSTYMFDGVLDAIYKVSYNFWADIAPSLSKTDYLSPINYVVTSPGMTPYYRVYELPSNPYTKTHFGYGGHNPQGNWQLYKSIVVDKDSNYGNSSVEYVPILKNSSYSNQSQYNIYPAVLAVTACTDVVSTGYSMKFNIGDTAISSMATTTGVYIPKIANNYSGIITKSVDIPLLSNTASKTISFYLKKDANTSVLYVSVWAVSVNSAYSNTSANNYLPTGSLIANVSTIPTTYTQYTNTYTFPSTTGNRLIFQPVLSGVPSNGAIYIDSISIT